jgi:uncharacterized protein (DUF433 family)
MAIAAIEHIEVDEKGVARVIGSRSKVEQIVMETMNGLTPDQIHEYYPHLSLAQIHAALAYYYDHKEVIDADLKAGREMVERMRREAGESPVAKQLRTQGLMPGQWQL